MGIQIVACCDRCRQAATSDTYFGPLTDEEYAARVLAEHGPAEADRLAEMHKAIAGSAGWRRRAASGYTLHAVRRRHGMTCIVIGDETGWRWQVWRDGEHRALRSIQGPPAPNAGEAVRLASALAGG